MNCLKSCIGVVAVALFAFTGAKADDKKVSAKAFDDAEFVKKAASGGMHEVEMGRLAARISTNAGVKSFGEKMMTDHSKANAELKMIAKEEGFSLPAKMMEDHQKHFDKFKSMSGADFDKAYVKHMVKDHEEDVEEFTQASQEAKNPKLKAFAAKTLPVIKEHLAMIKKLHEEIK